MSSTAALVLCGLALFRADVAENAAPGVESSRSVRADDFRAEVEGLRIVLLAPEQERAVVASSGGTMTLLKPGDVLAPEGRWRVLGIQSGLLTLSGPAGVELWLNTEEGPRFVEPAPPRAEPAAIPLSLGNAGASKEGRRIRKMSILDRSAEDAGAEGSSEAGARGFERDEAQGGSR